MITPRDLDKILSLLRRVYSVIVIDMSSHLNDVNLAFLDTSDTIIEIVTYDSTTIHNTVAMADTFRAIGYPAEQGPLPGQPGRLARRHRSGRPRAGARSRPGAPGRLGRHPRRPVEQRGRPVRARQPGRAGQPGRHAHGRGTARGRTGRHRRSAPLTVPHVRPTAPRCLRLGGGRPDGPPRDRPAVPERIHHLPGRQRAARRTGRGPTTRSWRSRRRPSTRSWSATSRRSSSPATPPRPSASPRSGAATTCRSWASSGPVRRRPRSRPGSGGSASSRRRPRSARTPTSRPSRTRTPPSRSTSTRRRRSSRWSSPAS